MSLPVFLEQETWHDYEIEFYYTSDSYYDPEISCSQDRFSVCFIKKHFDKPVEKRFFSKLFESHWESPQAYGFIENGALAAVIETAAENWNNRLRITNICVLPEYRGIGLGKALIQTSLKRAKSEQRRAIILETQSCNEKAIGFYLSQGFTFMGFNLCEYSNKDIENKEIRIEMGMLL